jgi:Asp-tRNA(Asn)/Glu-tRNA(Gln) amidotransferase A subunit family amidase
MRAEPDPWMSVIDVAAAVRAGTLAADAMSAVHRERIRRYDPQLHCYLSVDEGARALGEGALAGTTIAVKDSQPVVGLPWTFGSLQWAGRSAPSDAPFVDHLRRDGVAIIGKTNLPELAGAIGTTNDLIAATVNPWRAGTTPGGSSGGTAAAVAAGLACAGVGDDLGGSIRIPSASCGVVGLRPTIGRVRSDVVDPIGLNSIGPIARTVADVGAVFSSMIGESPVAMPPAAGTIAVVELEGSAVHPGCRDALARSVKGLKASGFATRTIPWDPTPFGEAYRVLRRVSLAAHPGDPGRYGAGVRDFIAEGRSISEKEFLRAHDLGRAAADALAAQLTGVDALLTPTLGSLPMAIAEVPPFLSARWSAHTAFVLPISFTGRPALSVPAGRWDGLPVGVQLTGERNGEWALLALAGTLEAVAGFGFERPPTFA